MQFYILSTVEDPNPIDTGNIKFILESLVILKKNIE